MQMTPERAFERFVLVKRFSGEMENNKGLILWLQYANVYRTTRGELLLGNKKIYELLRQSNSEEELATLFHSLRQVSGMENFADEMQIFMILSSASSRKLANEAWLKSQETPQEVYRILKLRDEGLDSSPLFLQWLRYIKLYKAHAEKDLPPNLQPFSDLQALECLMKEKRSVLKIGRSWKLSRALRI
ncbi:hypothetical protein L916_19900 [Phytophthora nicotianae]|uniref:Uncharacterized protein n=1 Tax=Phytophthora nicotianae TaxID=4792 RepID=W2HYW8_PHYNI|nr:hypothetical protein L916_19900 [Phytophthora nicotianae]